MVIILYEHLNEDQREYIMFSLIKIKEIDHFFLYPLHTRISSKVDVQSIEECKRILTQEVLRSCLSSAQDVHKVRGLFP